ncbi:PREDICTED: uncharacterized protein LOC105617133 [Atta cephalotes]|uniref:Uncharacterized protein n=1 Tax=Atta cephalotes TaxID=12957 RepID=A0A158N987_ATTCE|nr:PREDICTED: uncharacterized protein LOC105617133 [Atta cephalotes]
MRALYTLLILIAIGGIFERILVEAKPYKVERDGNLFSGRNLKNSLLNNIEENDYNIKRNYDDNHKICRRCNNYANDNDDITITDNPTTDSDDVDNIDIIDDIDDIVDIDDFLPGKNPKNSLQNNMKENDYNIKHNYNDDKDDDDDEAKAATMAITMTATTTMAMTTMTMRITAMTMMAMTTMAMTTMSAATATTKTTRAITEFVIFS